MSIQSILFENNQDGTTTVTMKMEGQEDFQFLLVVDIETLGDIIPQPAQEAAQQLVEEKAFLIPSDVEGA